MTPAARTEAAIGLLDQILSQPQQPADRIVAGWFRARRYAGAKDRAYITNLVYTMLRRRAELEWALGADDVGNANSRELTMAALAVDEQLAEGEVADRFSGTEHGPAVLTEQERAKLAGDRKSTRLNSSHT